MKRWFGLAIGVMGFSGLVAEVLLLRELLIVFAGNELSIGLIFANWLVLEAAGCFLSSRMVEKFSNKLEAFVAISILFSISLISAVFLTRILKNILGISIGESVGLAPMFYSSFFILLPASVFHGALFPFGCQIYAMFSTQDASSIGRVYVYETVGTLIGGAVATYLLVPYFHTFQVSVGLALLNIVVGFAFLALYWKTGRLQKVMVVFLSGLALLSGYLLLGGQVDQLHRRSIQAQWKNLHLVHYQNSQYGNICVVENEGQYIFFQDGIPSLITPVPDIIFVEEFVHLPLLAHPKPAHILIVSGGAGGVIHEMLKHPTVETVEYAELDPLLLSLLRKFPTPLTESELKDERVRIRYVDGRLLLRTTTNRYDLIFIGIMEPSNLQSNRFFTREFFSLAKNRLKEQGILVLGVPSSLTFFNEELRELNSCIFHTLKSAFPYIWVIPGDGQNLLLASDSPNISTISLALVLERLKERGIATEMIVPWYIEQKFHSGWQEWFAIFIEEGTRKINYDFQPLGLFYSIAHWNALFAPAFGHLFKQLEHVNLEGIATLLVLSLLVYFFLRLRGKRFFRAGITLSILTTGFAGMVFDLVVIFAFQSIYGYVFWWIGLLVASFMAGAACGAMGITAALGHIRNEFKLLARIELAILGLSIGLPPAFFALHSLAGSLNALPVLILFLLISFTCGLFTGSQFPLANQLYLKGGAGLTRTAGALYAADLLGGWVGGIVGTVVLLPVLGLTGTCLTVGLLKLTSWIIITTQSAGFVRR